MNIPILTNAHLAPMAGLTDDYNSNRNNDNVKIIMKVAVQDIPITALTVAPGSFVKQWIRV